MILLLLKLYEQWGSVGRSGPQGGATGEGHGVIKSKLHRQCRSQIHSDIHDRVLDFLYFYSHSLSDHFVFWGCLMILQEYSVCAVKVLNICIILLLLL